MLADFFFENEDALSPPPYAGGQYYLNHCRTATQVGWERAAETLRNERAASKQQKGAVRDPYRRNEAEERDAEDEEALEYWEQHADDTPPPEQDVRA